ncbi:MAG: DMT family transporter [Alphaproteobacteria bacterium]|nr:DMT family transporter [Alphaproteobacteria bacterium]
MMNIKLKGYFCLIFISLVWGSTWAVNKYVVIEGIPPLEIAFVRQLFAGILLLLFCFISNRHAKIQLKHFKWLFTIALLNFFLNNAIANIGLKYIPSSLAALIAALYPINLILIEVYFYKNFKLNTLTIIGIVLGFGGITFISILDNFYLEQNRFIIDWFFWFGIFLSVVALISWSICSVKLSRDAISLDPLYSISMQLIFGSLLIGIFMLMLPGKQFQKIPTYSFLPMLYLTIFGSILAYIAFQYSLKTLGMSITSLYAYINPIVTTIIAWIWLGEIMTQFTIIGSIITLLGVFLVNKSLAAQKNKIKMLTEADAI